MMRRLVLLTLTAGVLHVPAATAARPNPPRPATASLSFLLRPRTSRRRRSSPLVPSPRPPRLRCPGVTVRQDAAARAPAAHAVEVAEQTSRIRTPRCPGSAG